MMLKIWKTWWVIYRKKSTGETYLHLGWNLCRHASAHALFPHGCNTCQNGSLEAAERSLGGVARQQGHTTDGIMSLVGDSEIILMQMKVRAQLLPRHLRDGTDKLDTTARFYFDTWSFAGTFEAGGHGGDNPDGARCRYKREHDSRLGRVK